MLLFVRKKYIVLRKWPQSLWVSHDVYDELLFQARQGVIGAKRNLEAVREHLLLLEPGFPGTSETATLVHERQQRPRKLIPHRET